MSGDKYNGHEVTIELDLAELAKLKAGFDFKDRGDYGPVIQDRVRRFNEFESDPSLVEAWKNWYVENPWDFVDHWGHTIDPRLVNQGKRSNIPFLLFPKQTEYMRWLYERFTLREHGVVVKSRDAGVTWLDCEFVLVMWLFMQGFVGGIGSRKEEYVDQSKNMKAMMQRILHQLEYTPRCLWPPDLVWKKGKPTPESYAHKRLENPSNGSYIVGEAGDNIGRGDRYAIALVDEAAFLENQARVNAALSNTTECQIDVSTVNGAGNEFFRKMEHYRDTRQRFDFDWRDDPRKDLAWYEMMKAQLDPVIVAQEIDRDPFASNTNSFFDPAWIEFAVDAHERLKFDPIYTRILAWDPADGNDPHAAVHRVGNVIHDAVAEKMNVVEGEDWIHQRMDAFDPDIFIYDAEGMGSPVMQFSEEMRGKNEKVHSVAFYGSGPVLYPAHRFTTELEEVDTYGPEDVEGIQTNKERLENLRAQCFWWIRERLWRTWVEVCREKEGLSRGPHPNNSLISFSSACAHLRDLQAEMSIPRKVDSARNKIKVESKKELANRGVASTNLTDGVIMSELGKHPYNKSKMSRRGRRPSRGFKLPSYT